MKVYREEKNGMYPAIDSKYVANEYLAAMEDVSNTLTKLNMLKDRLAGLTKLTDDAGDPEFDLGDAIEKLGVALASINSYYVYFNMESKYPLGIDGNGEDEHGNKVAE